LYFTICIIFQRNIADAGDLAKEKYLELTPKSERSSEMITAFMNAAMDVKRVKLDSSLVKYLSVADLSLGHEFLAQIKRQIFGSNKITL
jgi:hypothetical protein